MAFNVANAISSDTSVAPNYRGIFKLLYLLIAIAVVFGLGLMVIYNGLIHDRNLADSAFSTIDIMLKRRADLIPNLVQAVKGYMQQEASLLTQITELRSQALQATRYSPEHLQAEGQLTAALGQFRAVVESYPDLKANEQFLRLQGALNECEEQIAAARRAFNAAIMQYNNRVEMFPSSLVAGAFGFQRRPFFRDP